MTDVSESAPTVAAASARSRSMLLRPSAANAVEPISKNPLREIGPGQNFVAGMARKLRREVGQPFQAEPAGGVRSMVVQRRWLIGSAWKGRPTNIRQIVRANERHLWLGAIFVPTVRPIPTRVPLNREARIECDFVGSHIFSKFRSRSPLSHFVDL